MDRMGARIFVSNLSLHWTADDLEAIFRDAGLSVHELNLIIDPTTGSSLGFAIVELRTKEDADAAVERFHGKVLNGRAVEVVPASLSTRFDTG
jgi:RNA recognition motif-containing protein